MHWWRYTDGRREGVGNLPNLREGILLFCSGIQNIVYKGGCYQAMEEK